MMMLSDGLIIYLSIIICSLMGKYMVMEIVFDDGGNHVHHATNLFGGL